MNSTDEKARRPEATLVDLAGGRWQRAQRPGAPPQPSSLKWWVLWLGFIALVRLVGLSSINDVLTLATASFFALRLLTTKGVRVGRSGWTMFWFLALTLLYVGLTLATPTSQGVTNTLAIASAACFFLFFHHHGQTTADLRGVTRIAFGVALACVILGRVQGHADKNTVSGVAIYFAILGGIIWLIRSRRPVRAGLVTFVIAAVAAFIMDHRAGVGFALAGSLLFATLTVVPLRIVRRVALLAIVGGIVILVLLFAGLGGLDIRNYNDLFIHLTGRTATSGRQVIWPIIIQAVSSSPYLGLGSGVTFSDLYSVNWSAHNYYLQTYMQSGLVGVTALVFLLLSLWYSVGRPRRGDALGAFMTATIAVVIVHSATEVFLMQANFVVGIVAWSALGLGLGAHSRHADAAEAVPSSAAQLGRGLPASRSSFKTVR